MIIRAKSIVYGNDIDTDVIIPARYLNTTDEKELAKHCMEDIDPLFGEKIKNYPIIAAGSNFGCGSSREHAPIALKACGTRLILAKSFARIFFRNAINIGLAIIECPAAADDCALGDELEFSPESGVLKNITQNKEYSTATFPPLLLDIIKSGGLMAYAAEKVKKYEV